MGALHGVDGPGEKELEVSSPDPRECPAQQDESVSFALPADGEAVYAEVVKSAPVSMNDLRAYAEDPAATRSWLARLAGMGLVWQDSSQLMHPSPPRAAAEAWAANRELEAAQARESAQRLAQLYDAQQQRLPAGVVEVIDGAKAVHGVLHALQASARHEVRALERGPYLEEDRPVPDDDQVAAMRRGVSYRAVYEAGVFHSAALLRAVRNCVAAGEQARVFPNLPMKLVLSDTDRALVPVYRPEVPEFYALVVYPSALLDALSEVFEVLWRFGAPVSGTAWADNSEIAGTSEEPNSEARQLLALLTAGLTDESIARMLGVSERTVTRRVSRLQELLGARNRFQLGVQASQRGWL